jgi:uncharacterized protein YbjT (DUF2867 family)
MTMPTLTVTGALGKTGHHVAEEALANGWHVRSAARRRPDHGEWIRFDWTDEETWRPAFAGSDSAYVIIPFRQPGAPERTPHLLEVAADCGVGKIVFLSTLDAEGAPEDNPSRRAELALRELPVRSAVLRPTWFLDNFTAGAFAAMTTAGTLRLPAGDGRIPFIDARDIAAVAVAASALDGPEGRLPLTGPASVTHHEVAVELAAAFGRPVTYVPTSPEEFVRLMSEAGFPEDYSVFLADALCDVAEGRLHIPVHDTVRQVLGRPGYTVAQFARHHAAHD